MDYGSFFGDGAARGTDFTADALHEGALAAVEHYAQGATPESPGHDAALARVQREYRQNRWEPATNRAELCRRTASGATKRSWIVIATCSRAAGRNPFIRPITFAMPLSCATSRVSSSGARGCARHNDPARVTATRTTGPTTSWSATGRARQSFTGASPPCWRLILALGAVLYLYGRYGRASGWNTGERHTVHVVNEQVRRLSTDPPAARVAYRFFVAAVVLFAVQVLAGILTVHDFLGLTRFFGVETAAALPITVTRGWHLQLALLWITTCWIGASLFLLSTMHREELPGQVAMARVLFWLLLLVVGGMFAGVWLGPLGLLGERWHLLSNQGWEFVELGKLWQVVLLAVFALWATLVGQTVLRVRREGDAWILPKWLFYAVLSIALLFLSAFVAKPTTNFVVADFWRWAVVHMWAEAFFEVFTTVLLAYVMYLSGFIRHAGASRIVYLATLLFLGSGLLGISHNFYWNAKPVATLAIGGIFSTLQVVPLILLTLEAWAFRSESAPRRAAPCRSRTRKRSCSCSGSISGTSSARACSASSSTCRSSTYY